MVSKKKQDSSSQTVPLEDREDPTEGSEEATELQMDTSEGERRDAVLYKGHHRGREDLGGK